MTHDTSAPMDIGQVRNIEGRKEKGQSKADNCGAKRIARMTLALLTNLGD